MNKLLIFLIGMVTLGASLPAAAGPDFQAIERARKAKQAEQVKMAGTGQKDCDSMKLVLPLDHGPRAQTTPYLNQQRRERFEAQRKACEDAKASSGQGTLK
ncbi:MAG: hypothetical protein ACREYA_36060 [Cupriavidus necator]